MRAVPVVAVKPSWQFGGSFFGSVVGLRISPLAKAGLNESLGLAVGLWRIGPGADVLEAEAPTGVLEGEGFVARAVVGHDALDRHAQGRIIGNGSLEEGDGASPFLILHDLAEGDPVSIVDADIHVFPAWARRLLWPVRSPVMRWPIWLNL